MKILHIDLKPIGNDYAEFRYFWDNPNDFQPRQLPLAEIKELIERAERDYYTIRPEDYAKTGQALYNWLDGSSRNLQSAIGKARDIVLAIAATSRLAHLPWEVLHDGQKFLVERAIIPVRWKTDSAKLTWDEQKKNRALNVLFMATSPQGVEPVLDFEAEEGRIIEATLRKPLSLIVEESGSLKEMRYLVENYEQDYFDVFHLTGHATKEDGKPCFITETELGKPEYSSAEDIARELQFELPKLIFLSGCETGYSWDKGTVPSMAEALLMEGATAVLGWGKKVSDTDATAAAATLYESLSAGNTVTEAVAKTYQTLIRNKALNWHLLRLYVAEKLPGALVTRGQKPVPRPSVATEFLDSENRVRVATRENFIGRRRQLQNCLRILKSPNEKIGVLIHGMGGLGKSTIAARLCDRLPEHQKIVWWRQIDESKLVNELAKNLIKPQLQELRVYLLNNSNNVNLESKLTYLFKELNDKGEKPLALVFDDFEWNLEPRDGGYILKSDVTRVLSALVGAIINQENISYHRIIITSRYDFEFDLWRHFYKQALEGFRKADLQKKLKQLKNFNSEQIDKELVERALKLADGNPRLLEWLNDEVLSKEDADSELSKFETSPELWKEKIIWIKDGAPKLKIDQSTEKVVSRCLVFEIPVPMPALEAVCEPISGYKEQLQRAIKLGLIEVSLEPEESKQVYRVSRIIPYIIPTIQLPDAPKVYSLYQKAHEQLHQLWGNRKNESEEKWLEIFRLKFVNRENPERFRQGFSQILAVQYNSEADNAFESELRKCADDLVNRGLCTQLENHLKQKQWKEADEETAWIFYQVMVKENYKDWDNCCANFPCETLAEINRLWLENSNNKFGISIQAEIYQSLGGTKKYNDEVWRKFCDHVGWRQGGDYLRYNDIVPLIDITTDMTHGELPASGGIFPALPVFYATREEMELPTESEWGRWEYVPSMIDTYDGSWKGPCGPRGARNRGWLDLFSRAKTCKV